MPNRTLKRAAAVTAILFLTAGCDVLETAASERVMTVLLLRSPDARNPQTGTPIAGAVSVQVFLGERTTFAGVSDAAVTLAWNDNGVNKSIAVLSTGGGYFATQSVTTPALNYVVGATYTVTATQANTVYSGTVQAPAAALIHEFQGRPVDRTISFSQVSSSPTFTLSRDGNDVAFYAVYPLGSSAQPLQPTCQNIPVDPSGLLRLAVDPSPWRLSSFSLTTAICFPTADNYLVTLTTVRQGSTSSTLFAGSILAGSSDYGLVSNGGPAGF